MPRAKPRGEGPAIVLTIVIPPGCYPERTQKLLDAIRRYAPGGSMMDGETIHGDKLPDLQPMQREGNRWRPVDGT